MGDGGESGTTWKYTTHLSVVACANFNSAKFFWERNSDKTIFRNFAAREIKVS